eukprot:TRINITY_DN2127_c1_g1_i1.p1 TRINITY_DN2127_c1_g1~~TRINITY_DN2127_c1_g1_i1.p1  ORF type:complete len:573 (+),score=98.00 TRINITY_DN2127_c1_g1_i1:47-1720(+)
MTHELTRMKREAWWKIVGHSDVKKATKDASNSDPWGPSVEQLKGLAAACYVSEDRAEVMHNLWKRIENGKPKNWRKIAKALVCLEYVMLHGPEDVVLEIRSGLYRLKPLKNFKCVDDKVDNGETVRYKVTNLLDLVQNDETVKQARESAKRTAQRITSNSSASPVNRSEPSISHMASRPRDRSPPPTSDEELARKLQQQFNREAGLPADYTGRGAHREVTSSDHEVPGVDLLQQHCIMNEIQAKHNAEHPPRAPNHPVEPRAAQPIQPPPTNTQSGYSSVTSPTWSLAPPTGASQGSRQRHVPQAQATPQAQAQPQAQPAAAQPHDFFGQQSQPQQQQQPQASNQPQQQPHHDFFFNAPQSQPQQGSLFAPQQQQQQQNMFSQPQQQPQQFNFQQQPPAQPVQQPAQAVFDPFAPTPQAQQAPPPQQVQQQPQHPQPDFNDFFSSLGQQSPVPSQPPAQPAPQPAAQFQVHQHPTLEPLAPVNQAPPQPDEITSPGLGLEKKLMADLDSFLTGGPKKETHAQKTLAELQGSHSQAQSAAYSNPQYSQPSSQGAMFHS